MNRFQRLMEHPSAWSHRIPAIALALCGAGIAGYLSWYQTGVIAGVWDPLFGHGSEAILASWFAHLLPVPDAGLGVLAYGGEAVLGSMGDAERWQSNPWLALIYGLVALMLASFGLGLVCLQAFVLRTGCSLCLLSALISWAIVGPALLEARAAIRHVREQATA